MKMTKALMLTLAFGATGAMAAEFWVRPELSGTTFDWTKKENYYTASTSKVVPTADPTTSDKICVPVNFQGKVSYGTASYTLLSNCTKVQLGNDSRFEVEVANAGDTAAWPKPLNNSIGGGTYTATIVKTGAGTLQFSSTSESSGSAYYDYLARLEIKAGTLRLPEGSVSGKTYRRSHDIVVDAGAKLVVGNLGNGSYLQVDGIISGEGEITSPDTVNLVNLTVNGNKTSGYECSFAGVISGKLAIRPINTRVNLLNTANSFTGGITCESVDPSKPSIIGAVDFGSSSGTPSSIGTGGITLKQNGGIAYAGTSAGTSGTSRSIYFNDYGTIVDGGEYGAFTLALQPRTPDNNNRVRWITFTGDGLEPNTWSGSFAERWPSGEAESDHVSHRIVKDGPGTWIFTARTDRNFAGVVEVNDGTLKFASLAAKGTACSLGTGDYLFAKEFKAASAATRVTDAFEIGGINTIATMEYTGASDVKCTDRTFALKGDARIKTDAGKLDLTGFKPLNGANATLRLAGSTQGNVIHDLTTPSGTVDLVKEGTGSWTLDGEMSFKGKVVVNGGALKVNRVDRYSWYRFIVKETYYTYTNSFPGVSIQPANWIKQYTGFFELGLFDADGQRQNLNLTKTSKGAASLAPGEYSYRNYSDGAITDGRPAADVFKDGLGDSNPIQISAGKPMVKNDNSSWVVIVMRLADGAHPIASYDMVAGYAPKSYSDAQWCLAPTAFELQGSFDGQNWVSLDVVDSMTPPDWYRNWYCRYNGSTAYTKGVNQEHKGYEAEIPTPKDVFNNVQSVRVADGAALQTTDDITVNGLEIDFDGAGTIDGFTFAETGVLNIVSHSKGFYQLPGTYTNVKGFDNIPNWTLKINGHTAHSQIAIEDGKIVIRRKGSYISIH